MKVWRILGISKGSKSKEVKEKEKIKKNEMFRGEKKRFSARRIEKKERRG